MKKYTITIEIEEFKKSNYMSSLIAEVHQEKTEMKIAKELNDKATEIRKEYFKDTLTDLNDELSILEIEEFDISSCRLSSNMATFKSTHVYIGNTCFYIELRPCHDTNVDNSTRYLTSTQDFDLYLYRIYSSDVFAERKVKNIEDILKQMEESIKDQLHKQL